MRDSRITVIAANTISSSLGRQRGFIATGAVSAPQGTASILATTVVLWLIFDSQCGHATETTRTSMPCIAWLLERYRCHKRWEIKHPQVREHARRPLRTAVCRGIACRVVARPSCREHMGPQRYQGQWVSRIASGCQRCGNSSREHKSAVHRHFADVHGITVGTSIFRLNRPFLLCNLFGMFLQSIQA